MNPTRWMVTALALGSAAARAELPVLSADVGLQANVISTRQFDLVSDNDLLALGQAGAQVTFELPSGALDVELAYHGGGTSTQAHGTTQASFGLVGVELGATWRYQWFSHLHPYAHLAVGMDWATLTLVDAVQLTQTVAHPAGTGLLGVQIPVRMGLKPTGRAPVLLLDLGLGYTLRPGYAFNALAPAAVHPAPADPIANGTVNAGTMPLSGLTYRIVVALKY